MQAIVLSPAAQDLLRRRAGGECVEVTDVTRPFYRELARAGFMTPLDSILRGREAIFRMTDEAWERRIELSRCA
jgi:hypothetical protein